MSADALQTHLMSGVTTVCRAWTVTRGDGEVLGFTDHDRGLEIAGVSFRPSSGMTARAVEQSTGLAVDNSEAIGALSDEAIRESDVEAGLYDGAVIESWLVNWAQPSERRLIFRGTLGEIERQGKTFRVELRGLSEALNQPKGQMYQRQCSAVLGDAACGVDVSHPDFSFEAELVEASAGGSLVFAAQSSFPDGWFGRGRFQILSGEAKGLIGRVRTDVTLPELRQLDLWETLRVPVQAGDRVRVEAGCDRRAETCRLKFGNLLNFRGFPDVPGEDWLVSYPLRAGLNNGGSLRR